MYGFLYRDLRIARPMLIASAIMLFYTILAPIFGALNLSDGNEEMTSYNIICPLCCQQDDRDKRGHDRRH